LPVNKDNQEAILTDGAKILTAHYQPLSTKSFFGKDDGDFRVKDDLLEKLIIGVDTQEKNLLQWLCQ
jgi:hypothetical protein